MKNPNRVEKFIQETFNLYLLDYQEFFQFMDSKTGEICKMPLVNNGKLEMSLVSRAATILGISVDSLAEMDEVETWKWWNKYDYFDLREAFDRVEAFSYIHEHDDVRRLDVAIWGGASAEIKPTRYDEADVFHRLIEELKEYDKFLPGSYHKDANIKGRMYVVNFFHYEDIDRLVRSYLAMVDRVKALFFKAWGGELCFEEINEYNFLVSVLGIQDIVFHKANHLKDTIEGVAEQQDYLYYDLLKKFAPVYKKEGFDDFFSFVKIKNEHIFEPWKCTEFCQNKGLVQDYVDMFPMAKQEMRRFSQAVSNFLCLYSWSDEPQNKNKPQYHKAYVPKSIAELNGDEYAIEAIRTLSGPVKLGGVLAHQPRGADEREHTRLLNRIMAAYPNGGGPHG